MANQEVHVRVSALARTGRTDRWWVTPAATAAGLILFFGYLTVRAFTPNYVWFAPYISPTVAPPLFTPASGYVGAVPVSHAWFGAFPTWWPSFLPGLGAERGSSADVGDPRYARHWVGLRPERIWPRVTFCGA